MTGVLPLSTVWCASFQYERRTTSRYSGSTYSLQISSGSLMCASQSKTGKVLVTRCWPLVTLMGLLRGAGGYAAPSAVLFSAPERARSRPRRGERGRRGGRSGPAVGRGVHAAAARQVAAVRLHHGQLAGLARRRPARERALDVRPQLLGLSPLPRRVPLLELRHDACREQLERGTDVLVAVVAPLLDEDGLVDARLLELVHGVAHLVRRADAAAPAGQRDLVAAEELPHVGAAGDVPAEQVVMREREAEELETLEAPALGLGRVVVAAEAGHHGDVGVHGLPDRRALALEGVVVVGDPVLRLRDVDEGEGEGAQAELRGQVDHGTRRAREPHRRVGLLDRLRHHVARRHLEVLAVVPGVGTLREHERHLRGRLLPHRALLGGRDAEALELHARGGLAGAELDPPARDQVEHRDPLGDARRMIVAGRHEDDAVAEADGLGARGAGGQEDLGRRGVRVLLQEVVLDLPGVVDAEPVGQLHLRERLADEPRLAVLLPGPGALVLVEAAELHGRESSCGRPYSAGATAVKRRRRI